MQPNETLLTTVSSQFGVPRLADIQNPLSFTDMVDMATRQADQPDTVRSCLSGVGRYIEELEAEVVLLRQKLGMAPGFAPRLLNTCQCGHHRASHLRGAKGDFCQKCDCAAFISEAR